MHDLDPGIATREYRPAERCTVCSTPALTSSSLVTSIADADRRLPARQLLGCRLRAVGVQIGDDHSAVCLHIALGDGIADAAGGSGDEGHFAIKVHNSSISSDDTRARGWRASIIATVPDFRP